MNAYLIGTLSQRTRPLFLRCRDLRVDQRFHDGGGEPHLQAIYRLAERTRLACARRTSFARLAKDAGGLRWPRFAGREVRFLKWILAACFGFPCLVLLRSRRACGKSE